MAKVYRKTQGVKNLASPTQTVGHCEFFIKSMREAATADRNWQLITSRWPRTAAAKPK
jgi:hypothetical protein